jgi:formate--tetrahydrofolate ligase
VQTTENTPALSTAGLSQISRRLQLHSCHKTALKLLITALPRQASALTSRGKVFGSSAAGFAFSKRGRACRDRRARSSTTGGKQGESESGEFRSARKGSSNLKAHIENLKNYGLPIVVAINHFYADTERESNGSRTSAQDSALRLSFPKRLRKAAAAREMAEEVCKACEQDLMLNFLYPDEYTLTQKIETLAENHLPRRRRRLFTRGFERITAIEEMGYGTFRFASQKAVFAFRRPEIVRLSSGYR